jgi:hypothetical protein
MFAYMCENKCSEIIVEQKGVNIPKKEKEKNKQACLIKHHTLLVEFEDVTLNISPAPSQSKEVMMGV